MKLLSRAEYENMISKFDKDYCAFCDENFKQIEVTDTENWKLIMNIAPYWKYHLLMYPKVHKEKLSELTSEDYKEITELFYHSVNLYKNKKMKHTHNGVSINQYILIYREKEIMDDLAKYKPKHLHIHVAPDFYERLDKSLDQDAFDVDIEWLLK